MASADYQITITLSPEEIEALKGEDGAPGKSAYEIAVDNGFEGPEEAWLASLEAEDGEDGADSVVPGPAGDSAYQVAVKNGFVGTEAEWLESLKGKDGTSTGGTPTIQGIIQMDSYPGNDDQKLAAAFSAVKSLTKQFAVQLPARDINLTKTIIMFTGMRLIAPFASEGPKNLELGTKYATHRIILANGMTLFNGPGSNVYDVFIDSLAVQGNFTQQFMAFTGGGTLYASVIRSITAYGLASTLGSHAVAMPITQVTTDGFWQIVGPRTCQVHVYGSDNHLWDNGYLNIGGDASAVPSDQYLIWLDGVGKTTLGPVYITAGFGNGLRLRGGSEGGITVRQAVIEGFHADKPAKQLVRVDGGMVNLQNLELGWANAAIIVTGGSVRVRDTDYYQDSAHQNVPLVVRNSGTVLQSGTATSWGTLTA